MVAGSIPAQSNSFNTKLMEEGPVRSRHVFSAPPLQIMKTSNASYPSLIINGNLTALDSVSRPKDSSEVPGFRLERVLS